MGVVIAFMILIFEMIFVFKSLINLTDISIVRAVGISVIITFSTYLMIRRSIKKGNFI
jgi:hypothetical protein